MTNTEFRQGGTTPLEPPAASRDQAPEPSIADRPRYDCRNAYVETLAELAHENHRIVGVVNDSVGSSKLDAFKRAFPDRLINVGIAEQDMVGVAAGLANGGRIAFVSAASCFLTARALEQIKADVAYSNRNVKLCGMSPGMAYGELGPTHHSIRTSRGCGPSTTSPSWCRPTRSRRQRPCAGQRRWKGLCSFGSAE